MFIKDILSKILFLFSTVTNRQVIAWVASQRIVQVSSALYNRYFILFWG